MCTRKPLFGFLAIALSLAASNAAEGQIYSSMYLSQAVFAEAPIHQDSFQNIVSATVPVQQTISASTTYGGNAQATYSVTDNGSVATFDMSASGSVTPLDYGAGEEPYDQDNGLFTGFSFTVPVRYTLSLNESGDGILNFALIGGAYVNVSVMDATKLFSGTIPANEPSEIEESWGLDNGNGVPTNQSGSDSIQFTFTPLTPIPEPTSMGLVAISTVALLRRDRHRRAGHGREPDHHRNLGRR